MSESCRNLFASETPPREVTGNQPLLLDDPDSIWLVDSGSLDVFAVAMRDGQVVGTRIHLFRAGVGQALFGLRLSPGEGYALLAVGLPDTHVLSMTKSRFRELASSAESAEASARLLEGWIEGVTAGIQRRGFPKSAHLLEPGGSMALSSGDAISPAQDFLWVRLSGTGRHCFLGLPEIAFDPSETWIPLARHGWLQVEGNLSVAAERTSEFLREGDFSPGLERFHEAVLSCVALNHRHDTEAERRRLERKTFKESQLIQSTMAQLAAVALQGGSPVLEGTGPAAGETPLLAACRIVGAALGVPIEAPRETTETRKSSLPVAAIARASRLRSRRVLLAGEWWRRDNGPLLAFRTEDERPVALIPRSPSQYDLVDPSDNTRIPVSAANAAIVSTFGHCFYAPFPEHELTPTAIFRFGSIGSRRDWITLLVLGLVGGLLSLMVPLAVSRIFDHVIPGGERGQLLLIVLALIVSALAAAVFQITQGVATLRLESRAECAVEAALWDRLLNLPVPFFRQYTAGDLAARVGGIDALRRTLSEAALSSLLSAVFSLMSFGLLFYFSVKLALLAVLLFVVTTSITIGAAVLQIRYERKDYEMRGRISGLVLQLITGISRLRVAAAESRALAVWARLFSQQRKLAFRARTISNYSAAFFAALPTLASLCLFAMVAYSLDQGMSLGAFLAFFAAFTQILMVSAEISSAVTSLLQVVPLFERAKPILETRPEIDRDKAYPGDLSGNIEISHVSFRYAPDGPLVLDDVSVRIRPGEFVAFVGPSGAGKSSLFRLMLGFDAPTAGSIFYDRKDLAGLDLQAVRRQIGVVLQNARIMPGELFRNILGSAPLTLDDAWEAARLSGLDQEIKQMPMGMFTVISEGGTTLSGGQRQRLMIARALAPKPRILFFDEATSALDNATQAKVSRSLEGLKTTRVVVAHRLSTVLKADRICVMNQGKIVQMGTYEELIGREGLFADLVRRQLL